MFAALVVGLGIAGGVAPPAKEHSLSGVVNDSSGRPVPNATVFVRTAAPRVGAGVLCPSCYRDCTKHAVTDPQGKFALKELDPTLVFRLLVVADGFVPAQSPGPADPQAGPVTFALARHDLDTRDPARVFRGRVVDEGGRPVAGAAVEPFGVVTAGGSQFGRLAGIDPLAVTDDKGAFRLGVPKAGTELYLHVTAPFLAPRKFARVRADGGGGDLALVPGVTVRGRLVKNGSPVADAAVGLAQKDRNGETFLGPFQAGTNKTGVFTLHNVPPDDRVLLYGLMDALRPHGAVAARELPTGKSGIKIDVGDVEVTAGLRLAGRVELSDGKAVPAGTRVVLARDEAWDQQQAVVDKDGAFAFTGLPAERYALSVGVPGYHLSAANASLDPLHGRRLLGVVRADAEE